MAEEKRALAYVLAKIEDEGFEYTFVSYSKFPQIADPEFHRLRRAYLKAHAKLAAHVGYEACDAEWHDDMDEPTPPPDTLTPDAAPPSPDPLLARIPPAARDIAGYLRAKGMTDDAIVAEIDRFRASRAPEDPR